MHWCQYGGKRTLEHLPVVLDICFILWLTVHLHSNYIPIWWASIHMCPVFTHLIPPHTHIHTCSPLFPSPYSCLTLLFSVSLFLSPLRWRGSSASCDEMFFLHPVTASLLPISGEVASSVCLQRLHLCLFTTHKWDDPLKGWKRYDIGRFVCARVSVLQWGPKVWEHYIYT